MARTGESQEEQLGLLRFDDEYGVPLTRSRQQKPARLHWSPVKLETSFRHSFLSTARLTPDLFDLARSRALAANTSPEVADAELDRLFARHMNRIWQSYTNSVLSDLRKVQNQRIADILKSVFFSSGHEVQAAPPKEAFESVIAFLRQQGSDVDTGTLARFQKRYEADENLVRVVGDIQRLQNEVRGLEEPRRKLEELMQEFFGEEKRIHVTDRDIHAASYGDTIQVESFSSGEKQLLRILVECIMAGGNTVMIDEPELSMHIDWQKRLLSTMRQINADSQIIVATHAPEIMADVDDRHIFEL